MNAAAAPAGANAAPLPPPLAHSLHMALTLRRDGFALQVDLQLPAQGITVLFGPSGSGKTTLLRCVAGLEQAQGQVTLGDEVWQDSTRGVFRPTWQRELGYVFQEASLFEHLSVQQNLNYGVRRVQRHGMQGTTGTPYRQTADGAQALADAVHLLGIDHLLQRGVGGLSGGERQRVAIARALATQPRLLLLDEPLVALDVARRKEILPWLERMHRELRIPVLYVTHSVDEMARLADNVVLLDHGTVQTSGPLHEALATTAVANVIGEEAGIVTAGTVALRDADTHLAQVRCDAGSLWVRDQGLNTSQAARLRILARDVSLALSCHDDCTIQNRLQGVIEAIDSDVHPSQALVRVRCGSTAVLSRVTRRALQQLALVPGVAVWCHVKSVALMD